MWIRFFLNLNNSLKETLKYLNAHAKDKRKKDRFVMPELKGKPARSTSVLTYYDKHGKLVKGTSDLGSEYKR